MTDLKTALHNAFNEAAPEAYGGFWQDLMGDDTASDHYDLNGSVNADRLATAVRDHFLDREKVRAALVNALTEANLRPDYGTVHELDRKFGDATSLIVTKTGNGYLGQAFDADKLVDRLIDGLAGKTWSGE